MSINLDVPLDALVRPGVAAALADLVRALGDATAAPVRATPAAAPAQVQARSTGNTPARRPAPPKPMAWPEFLRTLSPQTQRFLRLVVERKRLTMSAAMDEFGLTAKGLGGVTGALARKAGARGLELPYTQAKSSGGQRMWVAKPSVAGLLGL